MMDRRRFLSLSAAALAIQAFGSVSALAQWSPDGPVNLVVPFAAGSGTDAIARLIAQELSARLGANVLVDNRDGAQGMIAATHVARSEPDGQTLFMTTNTTHSANPALMLRLDYDPVADFTPIARVGNLPFMLVVGADSPAADANELIEMARAQPGELTYASGNSTGIVAGATLAHITGTDMVHVPYRSTPPAITDVLTGRVDFMFVDITAGLENVRSGRLRNLGVTTGERSRLLPDVPSLAEYALPGFNITSWNGVFAPAGVPDEIVRTWNRVIREAVEDPAVAERLANLGFDAFSGTPEELGTFVEEQLVVWRDLVEAAAIPRQ